MDFLFCAAALQWGVAMFTLDQDYKNYTVVLGAVLDGSTSEAVK